MPETAAGSTRPVPYLLTVHLVPEFPYRAAAPTGRPSRQPESRQVPCEQAVPPKEGDDSGGRKEDAEWHERRLEGHPSPPAANPGNGHDHHQERDGANRRTQEDGEKGTRRTERGSDDGHERDIAKAHRLSPERDLSEPADDRDRSSPDACANQCVVRQGESATVTDEGAYDGRREEPDQAKHGEPVWDEIVE